MAGDGLDQPGVDRRRRVSTTMGIDIRQMAIDDYDAALALWEACEGVGLHRRGIGRALVERCMSALSRAGVRKCNIHVLEGNKDALAFWNRLGWVGRRDVITMSSETCGES